MKKIDTALKVIKKVGVVVISIGIGAVAANLIKATTPEDVKKLTKICIGIGSYFVAGMAAKAASDKFGGTMDQVRNVVKVFVEGNNETEVQEVVEMEA